MSQPQGVEEVIGFGLSIQDQIEVLTERGELMSINPKTALQQAVTLWLEQHR